MSIFKKRGLLLDNKLNDVQNKISAVNNLLARYAGGQTEALSLADLAPLIGISSKLSDDNFYPRTSDSQIRTQRQLYKRVGQSPTFAEDVESFQNKIDNGIKYVQMPSYFGGNGLNGRFYSVSELPLSSLTHSDINADLDNNPDVLFGSISPGFTIDDLKETTALVYDDTQWLSGNLQFPKKSSMLNNTPGIRVALFTGFVKFADAVENQSFADINETYDGISFNHNVELFDTTYTNVITRIIIEDVESGEKLLNILYDPLHEDSPAPTKKVTEEAQNYLLEDNKKFENFKEYKISIVFIITDEILSNFNEPKKADIKWLVSNVGYGETQIMYRNYFYTEDYNSDSPGLGESNVRINEKKALAKYGSLLNMKESVGPTPTLPEFDYSQQIGTPSSYNDILINKSLEFSYEPKSGGYESIKKVSAHPNEYVLGSNFISFPNSFYTRNIAIQNIEPGNFVDGVTSTTGNPVYVKAVSLRQRTVYFTEEAISDSSPLDIITFIDHRGLATVGEITANEDPYVTNLGGITSYYPFVSPHPPLRDEAWYTCGDAITIPGSASWEAEVDMVITQWNTGTGLNPFESSVYNHFGAHIDSSGLMTIKSRSNTFLEYNLINDGGVTLGVPFTLRWGYQHESPGPRLFIHVSPSGGNPTSIYSTEVGNQSATYTYEWYIFKEWSSILVSVYGIKSAKLTVDGEVVRDYRHLTTTETIIDSSINEQHAVLDGAGSPQTGDNIAVIKYLDYNGSPDSSTFDQLTYTFTKTFDNSPDLKVGDFIFVKGLGDTTIKYARVKYTSPLVFEKIDTTNQLSDLSSISSNHTAFVYKKSALDNLVLDKFCLLDNQTPFTSPLIKAVVKQDGSSGDNTITISDTLVNYRGEIVYDSPPSLVNKYVVFDGGDVNSVIPQDTQIQSFTSPGPGQIDITLNKSLGGSLPDGSFLTIADDFNTANKKFICFPPTDPAAPFKSDGDDISTVPVASGRHTVDFTTGQQGADTVVEFNGLKLIDVASPGMIQPHTNSSNEAPYEKVLKILTDEPDASGIINEVEYHIPLKTV